MTYFVYLIVSNLKNNKKISYVGYTNNLKNRILKHNCGSGAKSTKGYKWEVVYKKKFYSKKKALSFEYKLKKDRKERLKLIYDFTMLGDIHKRQFLTKTMAYPGSPIQQNYGEDTEKGFLFWDIKDKDDFTVKFIPLHNQHAFRTIQWAGDVVETLEQIPDDWVGSRFRIAHKGINQLDFRQLQSALKEKFDAFEVVSKNESSAMTGGEVEITTSIGKISRNDLRNFSQQDQLMSDFVAKLELEEDDRERLRSLHKDIFKRCVQQAANKSHQWRLRKLSFDNTFGYGESNVIDFDALSGITGIFGKNRSGKSSIPGTLVYSLFNSTDRGVLKNMHVINNRKTFCRATTDFSVGGEMYRADRQTIKRVSRKGAVSAPTNLNLFKIGSDGEPIEDNTGEQRRETEKVLRTLVGSVDDFLMTSFASQGEMNAFIREGSTRRKAILTRFLDLQMFDDMLKIAKNEMSELRGEMKSAPDKNWNLLIEEQNELLASFNDERVEVEEELAELKEKRDELKIKMAALPSAGKYTKSQITAQVGKLNDLEKKASKLEKEIIALSTERDGVSKRLEKIEAIREQFPIDDLREQADLMKQLQRQCELAEANLNLEIQKLDSKKKLAKKLEKASKAHAAQAKALRGIKKANKGYFNDQPIEKTRKQDFFLDKMPTRDPYNGPLIKENLDGQEVSNKSSVAYYKGMIDV